MPNSSVGGPSPAEEYVLKTNDVFYALLRKNHSAALTLGAEIAAIADRYAQEHNIKMPAPAAPGDATKTTPAAQRYRARIEQAESQLRASGRPLKPRKP